MHTRLLLLIVFVLPGCLSSSLIKKITNLKGNGKILIDFVEKQGYNIEEYRVETEDGCILTYHRIWHSRVNKENRTGYPVLLQHGLGTSSSAFLIPDKNALAYVLADAGYDVWLGNSRGNRYSQSNTNKNPTSNEFLGHRFQDYGMLDLAAGVDRVLSVTGWQNLALLGHSHGATKALVLLASRPSYLTKIRVLLALAPAVFLGPGHLRLAEAYRHFMKRSVDRASLSGNWSSFPRFPTGLEDEVCRTSKRCLQILGLLRGTVQPKSWSIIELFQPAGTSTENLQEVLQQIRNGPLFKHFDYGPSENLKIYNAESPPVYDLSKVTVPVHVYFTSTDVFITPEDIQTLAAALPNVTLHPVKNIKFNHFDFLWSPLAKDLVYKNIQLVLKQYSVSQSKELVSNTALEDSLEIVPNSRLLKATERFLRHLESTYNIDRSIGRIEIVKLLNDSTTNSNGSRKVWRNSNPSNYVVNTKQIINNAVIQNIYDELTLLTHHAKYLESQYKVHIKVTDNSVIEIEHFDRLWQNVFLQNDCDKSCRNIFDNLKYLRKYASLLDRPHIEVFSPKYVIKTNYDFFKNELVSLFAKTDKKGNIDMTSSSVRQAMSKLQSSTSALRALVVAVNDIFDLLSKLSNHKKYLNNQFHVQITSTDSVSLEIVNFNMFLTNNFFNKSNCTFQCKEVNYIKSNLSKYSGLLNASGINIDNPSTYIEADVWNNLMGDKSIRVLTHVNSHRDATKGETKSNMPLDKLNNLKMVLQNFTNKDSIIITKHNVNRVLRSTEYSELQKTLLKDILLVIFEALRNLTRFKEYISSVYKVTIIESTYQQITIENFKKLWTDVFSSATLCSDECLKIKKYLIKISSFKELLFKKIITIDNVNNYFNTESGRQGLNATESIISLPNEMSQTVGVDNVLSRLSKYLNHIQKTYNVTNPSSVLVKDDVRNIKSFITNLNISKEQQFKLRNDTSQTGCSRNTDEDFDDIMNKLKVYQAHIQSTYNLGGLTPANKDAGNIDVLLNQLNETRNNCVGDCKEMQILMKRICRFQKHIKGMYFNNTFTVPNIECGQLHPTTFISSKDDKIKMDDTSPILKEDQGQSQHIKHPPSTQPSTNISNIAQTVNLKSLGGGQNVSVFRSTNVGKIDRISRKSSISTINNTDFITNKLQKYLKHLQETYGVAGESSNSVTKDVKSIQKILKNLNETNKKCNETCMISETNIPDIDRFLKHLKETYFKQDFRTEFEAPKIYSYTNVKESFKNGIGQFFHNGKDKNLVDLTSGAVIRFISTMVEDEYKRFYLSIVYELYEELHKLTKYKVYLRSMYNVSIELTENMTIAVTHLSNLWKNKNKMNSSCNKTCIKVNGIKAALHKYKGELQSDRIKIDNPKNYKEIITGNIKEKKGYNKNNETSKSNSPVNAISNKISDQPNYSDNVLWPLFETRGNKRLIDLSSEKAKGLLNSTKTTDTARRTLYVDTIYLIYDTLLRLETYKVDLMKTYNVEFTITNHSRIIVKNIGNIFNLKLGTESCDDKCYKIRTLMNSLGRFKSMILNNTYIQIDNPRGYIDRKTKTMIRSNNEKVNYITGLVNLKSPSINATSDLSQGVSNISYLVDISIKLQKYLHHISSTYNIGANNTKYELDIRNIDAFIKDIEKVKEQCSSKCTEADSLLEKVRRFQKHLIETYHLHNTSEIGFDQRRPTVKVEVKDNIDDNKVGNEYKTKYNQGQEKNYNVVNKSNELSSNITKHGTNKDNRNKKWEEINTKESLTHEKEMLNKTKTFENTSRTEECKNNTSTNIGSKNTTTGIVPDYFNNSLSILSPLFYTNGDNHNINLSSKNVMGLFNVTKPLDTGRRTLYVDTLYLIYNTLQRLETYKVDLMRTYNVEFTITNHSRIIVKNIGNIFNLKLGTESCDDKCSKIRTLINSLGRFKSMFLNNTYIQIDNPSSYFDRKTKTIIRSNIENIKHVTGSVDLNAPSNISISYLVDISIKLQKYLQHIRSTYNIGANNTKYELDIRNIDAFIKDINKVKEQCSSKCTEADSLLEKVRRFQKHLIETYHFNFSSGIGYDQRRPTFKDIDDNKLGNDGNTNYNKGQEQNRTVVNKLNKSNEVSSNITIHGTDKVNRSENREEIKKKEPLTYEKETLNKAQTIENSSKSEYYKNNTSSTKIGSKITSAGIDPDHFNNSLSILWPLFHRTGDSHNIDLSSKNVMRLFNMTKPLDTARRTLYVDTIYLIYNTLLSLETYKVDLMKTYNVEFTITNGSRIIVKNIGNMFNLKPKTKSCDDNCRKIGSLINGLENFKAMFLNNTYIRIDKPSGYIDRNTASIIRPNNDKVKHITGFVNSKSPSINSASDHSRTVSNISHLVDMSIKLQKYLHHINSTYTIGANNTKYELDIRNIDAFIKDIEKVKEQCSSKCTEADSLLEKVRRFQKHLIETYRFNITPGIGHDQQRPTIKALDNNEDVNVNNTNYTQGQEQNYKVINKLNISNEVSPNITKHGTINVNRSDKREGINTKESLIHEKETLKKTQTIENSSKSEDYKNNTTRIKISSKRTTSGKVADQFNNSLSILWPLFHRTGDNHNIDLSSKIVMGLFNMTKPLDTGRLSLYVDTIYLIYDTLLRLETYRVDLMKTFNVEFTITNNSRIIVKNIGNIFNLKLKIKSCDENCRKIRSLINGLEKFNAMFLNNTYIQIDNPSSYIDRKTKTIIRSSIENIKHVTGSVDLNAPSNISISYLTDISIKLQKYLQHIRSTYNIGANNIKSKLDIRNIDAFIKDIEKVKEQCSSKCTEADSLLEKVRRFQKHLIETYHFNFSSGIGHDQRRPTFKDVLNNKVGNDNSTNYKKGQEQNHTVVNKPSKSNEVSFNITKHGTKKVNRSEIREEINTKESLNHEKKVLNKTQTIENSSKSNYYKNNTSSTKIGSKITSAGIVPDHFNNSLSILWPLFHRNGDKHDIDLSSKSVMGLFNTTKPLDTARRTLYVDTIYLIYDTLLRLETYKVYLMKTFNVEFIITNHSRIIVKNIGNIFNLKLGTESCDDKCHKIKSLINSLGRNKAMFLNNTYIRIDKPSGYIDRNTALIIRPNIDKVRHITGFVNSKSPSINSASDHSPGISNISHLVDISIKLQKYLHHISSTYNIGANNTKYELDIRNIDAFIKDIEKVKEQCSSKCTEADSLLEKVRRFQKHLIETYRFNITPGIGHDQQRPTIKALDDNEDVNVNNTNYTQGQEQNYKVINKLNISNEVSSNITKHGTNKVNRNDKREGINTKESLIHEKETLKKTQTIENSSKSEDYKNNTTRTKIGSKRTTSGKVADQFNNSLSILWPLFHRTGDNHVIDLSSNNVMRLFNMTRPMDTERRTLYVDTIYLIYDTLLKLGTYKVDLMKTFNVEFKITNSSRIIVKNIGNIFNLKLKLKACDDKCYKVRTLINGLEKFKALFLNNTFIEIDNPNGYVDRITASIIRPSIEHLQTGSGLSYSNTSLLYFINYYIKSLEFFLLKLPKMNSKVAGSQLHEDVRTIKELLANLNRLKETNNSSTIEIDKIILKVKEFQKYLHKTYSYLLQPKNVTTLYQKVKSSFSKELWSLIRGNGISQTIDLTVTSFKEKFGNMSGDKYLRTMFVKTVNEIYKVLQVLVTFKDYLRINFNINIKSSNHNGFVFHNFKNIFFIFNSTTTNCTETCMKVKTYLDNLSQYWNLLNVTTLKIDKPVSTQTRELGTSSVSHLVDISRRLQKYLIHIQSKYNLGSNNSQSALDIREINELIKDIDTVKRQCTNDCTEADSLLEKFDRFRKHLIQTYDFNTTLGTGPSQESPLVEDIPRDTSVNIRKVQAHKPGSDIVDHKQNSHHRKTTDKIISMVLDTSSQIPRNLDDEQQYDSDLITNVRKFKKHIKSKYEVV